MILIHGMLVSMLEEIARELERIRDRLQAIEEREGKILALVGAVWKELKRPESQALRDGGRGEL
jgi:hypothetical protein